MKHVWLSLSIAEKAMLTGKLLGDGGITKQKGRKPRFQFTHCVRDAEWSFHCYEKLRNTLPLNAPQENRIIDARLKKGYSERVICQSRTSPLVTFLHKEWYTEKKIIPFNIIRDCFTTETLAWWYQDDGSLKVCNQRPQKIVMSTECFNAQECKALINLIKQIFQISFSLDGKNRLVLYDQASIYYFLSLVRPHMVSCMSRKNLNFPHKMKSTESRRTTISLPKTINMIKPTSEINETLQHLTMINNSLDEGTFYNLYYHMLPHKDQKLRSYQVVINAENLSLLNMLKQKTGFTFNSLALLCFLNKKGTSL